MKPGRYFSKFTISLSIVLSAFVFISPAEAAKETLPAEKASTGNESESLSIQSVASELLAVAKEEYNKALFDTAYQTLLKAKQYEKFLSPAEQNELNKYLQASKDAVAKRNEALEHIRTAKKDAQAGQIIQAKAHLKEVETSPFLTANEKDAVAVSLKKIDSMLKEQEQQLKQIYDDSVNLYKNGKPAEAREGFIKVAQSGLLELPDGKTAEDYIHKIDTQMGKSVTRLPDKPVTALKTAESSQPPVLTIAPLPQVVKEQRSPKENNAEASINKSEIPNLKSMIKNTVAEGYLKAVINDTILKVNTFKNIGNSSEAKKCISDASTILNENRRYLDDSTFKEYITILNNLSTQLNREIKD